MRLARRGKSSSESLKICSISASASPASRAGSGAFSLRRASVVVFLRRLREPRPMVEGGGAHAGNKIHKKREPDFIKQFAQDHFIKKRRRKRDWFVSIRLNMYRHSASHSSGERCLISLSAVW